MSVTRKIYATHNGKTFVRRTPRNYTHAVVSAPGPSAITNAEIMVRTWERRLAEHDAGTPWGDRSREQLAAYLDEAQTFLAQTRDAYAAGRPTFVTWHQRADLASKEAAKRSTRGYYSAVAIVDVRQGLRQ